MKLHILKLAIAGTSIYLMMAFAPPSSIKPPIKFSSIEHTEVRALTLLQVQCFTCHNPDWEIHDRLAPPMFKVRNHYLTDDISKKRFVKKITAFAGEPNEKHSLMPGAIRNFGLMPKQVFNKKELVEIAEYIYENDLESDEWYAKWETFKLSKSDMLESQ